MTTLLSVSKLSRMPRGQIAAVIDAELNAITVVERRFRCWKNARLRRVGQLWQLIA